MTCHIVIVRVERCELVAKVYHHTCRTCSHSAKTYPISTHLEFHPVSCQTSFVGMSNGAMDKCDAGRSEWTGWWSTMAGIHMFVGILFLVAPANLLPYMGTSGHLTDTGRVHTPTSSRCAYIHMYAQHSFAQCKHKTVQLTGRRESNASTLRSAWIGSRAVVFRCDVSVRSLERPRTLTTFNI